MTRKPLECCSSLMVSTSASRFSAVGFCHYGLFVTTRFLQIAKCQLQTRMEGSVYYFAMTDVLGSVGLRLQILARLSKTSLACVLFAAFYVIREVCGRVRNLSVSLQSFMSLRTRLQWFIDITVIAV